MSSRSTARRSRAGRLLPTASLHAGAFVMLLLAMLALGAPPAGAQTTLDVTTPADGRYQPGRPTPLIVTIEADRAISGTLNATFEGFRAGSQRVEVPGGSAKDIVFIVTIPPWSGGGTISFNGDDPEDDQTARINLVAAGGDELVAVLPELAARDLPASADVAADIGVARLFPLDVELLDSGSEVLGPFTQVIATRGDLDSLEDSRLTALEAWIGADGGVLVVDEDPGTQLPIDLGDASSTLGPNSFGFGLGTVVFSGGEAANGAYDGLLRATPSASPDEFPWGGGFGGFPTTNILASDAGVRIPAIGSIVLVLIGYAVVVGPVLWFVLRRTKREPLLWLVLPAIALLTTGGVYVAGQAIRDDTSTAHATIYADLPTQRLVASQVLVTAPNGGTAGVQLPEGWRPAKAVSEEVFFDGPFGGAAAAASGEAVLEGTDLVIDLPPGGVGVISAEATQPVADPSWGFEFEADGDDLVGTVTNLTAHDLEEVFVTSASGFSRIAEVAAGETAEVTLRRVGQPLLEGDPMMERLWRFDGFNGDPDGVVNPGLLSNWVSSRPRLRSQGFVMIVGWTRDETAPIVSTNGAPVEAGRTAFLTADRLNAESISPTQGRIEFLRGWNSTRVEDPIAPNECGDFPVTLRMTPGPGVDADQAALEISRRAVAAFDVWDGSAWQPAGMAAAVPNNDLVVSIPTSAFEDGSIYLKLNMGCEFWGMADPFPKVRNTVADDDVLQIGALDQGDADPNDEGGGGDEGGGASGPATTLARTLPEDETTVTTEAGQ